MNTWISYLLKWSTPLTLLLLTIGCGSKTHTLQVDIGVPISRSVQGSINLMETISRSENNALISTEIGPVIAENECIQDQMIFGIDTTPDAGTPTMTTKRIFGISKIISPSQATLDCGNFKYMTSDSEAGNDMPNLLSCLILNGNLRLSEPITATLAQNAKIGFGIGGYLVKPVGRDDKGRCKKFSSLIQRTLEGATYPNLPATAQVPVETFSFFGSKTVTLSGTESLQALNISIFPAQMLSPKTIFGTQIAAGTYTCASIPEDLSQSCPAKNFIKMVWNQYPNPCAPGTTCNSQGYACPGGSFSCSSTTQLNDISTTGKSVAFSVDLFPNSAGEFLIKQNFLSLGSNLSSQLAQRMYAIVPDLPGDLRVTYMELPNNASATEIPAACTNAGGAVNSCFQDRYNKAPKSTYFNPVPNNDRRFYIQTYGNLNN